MFITPEEGAEREPLLKDYQNSGARALAAPSPYDAAAFAAAEAEQAAIVRRLREIDGTTGQPWNA
jgi:hypothetical protein